MSVLRPSGVRSPQGAIYVISLKGWVKVFSLKGWVYYVETVFYYFEVNDEAKDNQNLPHDDVEVNDLSVALSLYILIRRMLTYAVRPASFDP